MRTDDVRATPLDPKYVQLAGMHAELIYRMSELVDTLSADSRRKEALEGRTELAVVEEEYAFSPAGTLIQLQPKTSNYVEVQQITWSIPNGATATLQLGDRQIPIVAQMNSIAAKMILSPADVRTLTLSAGGVAFLHLAGRILSPQSWLH